MSNFSPFSPFGYIWRLLDQSARPVVEGPAAEKIDWFVAIPYFSIHLMCLGVIWAGFSWLALSVCVFLYALRVFALTGWYHRYFAHRSFKTSRSVQFIFAVVGCSAMQKGPLWWAAHHRHHHAHSDDPLDIHSPRQQGTLWAHMLWFLTPKSAPTNLRLIPDFAKYPELRILDRFHVFVPITLAVCLYGFGAMVAWQAPDWGVTGFQMLIWGFFISTVACYHVTYLVNSATHLIGSRRYETKDDSKNSLIIALLTFGEGWHNNHHYYQNSTRQGFFWWEIDITYYILCFMSCFGLVWNLKGVPARILHPKPKAVPLETSALANPSCALPS